MRALVLQAVYGGRGQTPGRFRKALIRGESSFKSTTVVSDVDTDSEGNTSDVYTSGDIASDEEIGLAGFGMGTASNSEASTIEFSTVARKESTLPDSQHATVPSPGYSEGDYEPLASMQPQTERQNAVSSPPRKRRRLMSRPGLNSQPIPKAINGRKYSSLGH